MIRKDVKWYYPENIEEAFSLLKDSNNVLHAGGTGILRAKSAGISGFVDLNRLKLDYIKENDNEVEIGAMTTFNQVIEYFKGEKGGKKCGGSVGLLCDSLELAASYPLRNRITIGGSLVDFQPWTDLMAPLFAADAKVNFYNENKHNQLPVIDFVNNFNKLKPLVVISIVFEKKESYFYFVKRLVRVNFDYAAFNISALLNIENKVIKSSKFFITGVPGRFKELEELEKYLQDKSLDENLIEKLDEFIKIKFIRDYRFSAAYKERSLKVFIKDGLSEILNELK